MDKSRVLSGLGLTDADIGKSFIAIATTHGNVTPCNAGLAAHAAESAEAPSQALARAGVAPGAWPMGTCVAGRVPPST